MKRTEAVVTILFCVVVGWFIPTMLVHAGEKIFGLLYEQIIGILIGLLVGVFLSAFVGERKPLNKFFMQVRNETFSFISLSITLCLFGLNFVFPSAIPSVLPQSGVPVMPNGGTHNMFITVIIGVVLALISIFFILKIRGKK